MTTDKAKEIIFQAQMAAYPNEQHAKTLGGLYALIEELEQYRALGDLDHGFMDGTIVSMADTSALISHEPTNTCRMKSRQCYDQMISLSALERNRRAQKEPLTTILNALRSRLHGLSYESKDWSHGEHPRVVEVGEIDDLMDEFDELAQQENKPLTLEELRGMEGEPIWTVTNGVEGSGRWELCACETLCVCPLRQVLRCVTADGEVTDYDFGSYGQTWLAYRSKPMEGDV